MINIILYQPEIPPNTGNIIRTCFATKSRLHIIKPIAFDLKPKWLKRAAAGKWLSDIEYEIHENYDEFNKKYQNKKIWYITRYGQKTYSNANFKNEEEIWLMFGRESTGIPKEILKNNFEYCLRIPMIKENRSVNLANCVFLLTYEVLRQNNFKNLSKFEIQKGKNWILE